jgi:CubicO group peptidase (beta-lactamase class C family)
MDIEAIDRELAGRSDDHRFYGSIRIDRAGSTLLRRAYGWASPTWRIASTPQTRYDTASVTKLFTAVAVLQQVDAGSFTLDTGVVEYLGLVGTTISPAVTPYHLLTHTSGIADDAEEEAGEDYADLFTVRANYIIRETSDFLPQFAYKPPNFAPGQSCRYCNCSYVLLGLMVERATGMSYRAYVTEHVFGPAGMDRSGFFSMDVVEPDVAEGLTPITAPGTAEPRWRRSIYSYPPTGSPDGGAHVTADDLIAFHTALTEGRLLSPASTAAILSPHEDWGPRPPGMHRVGFGFEFDVVADTVRCYWKEGVNTGASAILQHYPGADVTVAMVSNLQDGVWEPLALIDAMVLG